MDSTSNKNTNTNNTNNHQEQEPFASFNHPLTFNPTSKSSTQPPASPTARSSKRRTRASRRAPTMVLTTDTSNFRSMVQQFTGFPTPPFPTPPPPPSFSSSSSPYCAPIGPTASSFIGSSAALNAAINGNISLENVINSNTAALASYYPFVNPNTVLAPKFGDLGRSSGGWSERGDRQNDLNIRHELVQPPYKRQATRGTKGAVMD